MLLEKCQSLRIQMRSFDLPFPLCRIQPHHREEEYTQQSAPSYIISSLRSWAKVKLVKPIIPYRFEIYLYTSTLLKCTHVDHVEKEKQAVNNRRQKTYKPRRKCMLFFVFSSSFFLPMGSHWWFKKLFLSNIVF